MTDLYEIQRYVVARIDQRPDGSASRFALMDAADAICRAIAAEAREVGAQTAHLDPAHHPETQQSRAPDIGAELGGHRP
ncbi:hypothetical protein [Brevundimonas diminuta]|uniref:hypothetical protein n=1 Tax=Brevundimonas diminuta TaxID=293 RepID=UPI00058C5A9B|nr:hypothetical protein [Brevundimonas diminuta]OWR16761.1 hypothetical protein CD944_15580 [Brevundimonas diminuta]WQE44788.1 hypothetical protein U0020_14510 [Brevundimonas diminuta]